MDTPRMQSKRLLQSATTTSKKTGNGNGNGNGNRNQKRSIFRKLAIFGIVVVVILLIALFTIRHVGEHFAIHPGHLQQSMNSRGLIFRPSPMPLLREKDRSLQSEESLLKDLDTGDLLVHFPIWDVKNEWNNFNDVPHATMFFGTWKGAVRAVHLSDRGLTMARMSKIAGAHRTLIVRKLRCPEALRIKLKKVSEEMVEQELARSLSNKEFRPAFNYRGLRLALGFADVPQAGYMCSTSILALLEKAGILIPSAGGLGIQHANPQSHFWTPWQLLDIDGVRPVTLQWAEGCSWDTPFVWDDVVPLVEPS